MTYLEYVVMAYAVFAVVMLWDFLAPRLQLRSARREAQRRAASASRRQAPADDLELSR
jgi:heme exporter protein D